MREGGDGVRYEGRRREGGVIMYAYRGGRYKNTVRKCGSGNV